MLNLSVKSQIMKIGKHKGKTMYYAQVDKPRSSTRTSSKTLQRCPP
ncbi:HU family DNA-binding protein [Porphyromonas gulae]